jgi:hypothetical protein
VCFLCTRNGVFPLYTSIYLEALKRQRKCQDNWFPRRDSNPWTILSATHSTAGFRCIMQTPGICADAGARPWPISMWRGSRDSGPVAQRGCKFVIGGRGTHPNVDRGMYGAAERSGQGNVPAGRQARDRAANTRQPSHRILREDCTDFGQPCSDLELQTVGCRNL